MPNVEVSLEVYCHTRGLQEEIVHSFKVDAVGAESGAEARDEIIEKMRAAIESANREDVKDMLQETLDKLLAGVDEGKELLDGIDALDK